MKYRILFLLLIAFCIICTACSGNKPLKYETEEKVQTVEAKSTKHIVPYIQIKNCTDAELQEKVNAILISAVADTFAKDQREWVGISDMSVSVTCQTEEYLSLLYYKGLEKGGGSLRIGITIDMKTGERIFLDHFFEAEEQLYEAIKGYEPDPGEWGFPPIDMDLANKLFIAASLNELEYLEQKAEKDPYVYEGIISDLRLKPTFYLTLTELVVTRDSFALNDVFIPLDNGYLIH